MVWYLVEHRENLIFCALAQRSDLFQDFTSNCIRKKPFNVPPFIMENVFIMSAIVSSNNIQVRIQKFPDWPPGARTANGTALCH
jgi:hypothetical protein